MLLCVVFSVSAPSTACPEPGSRYVPVLIDNDDRMDVNNLDMAVTNHGSISYDLTTGNAGLVYPKGTTNTAVFAAGIWIGAKVSGQVRTAIGEYLSEYAPGPMVGGASQPDRFEFRNYRIDRSGNGYPEYLQYAVLQGAPLDAGGDPLLLGDALLWSVFNDADPTLHHNVAGSTAPLGIEVQQSVFAFNRAGTLGDVIFVKWRLANKGGNQLDDTYVSFWADPDLGGFTDDLVGCDTTMSLGYCYNATNADGQYGSTPPAVGFQLLQGAIAGGDTLGMTSFVRYINGTDPASATETYSYMSGSHPGGAIHVCDDPLLPTTTYEMPGNPALPASCPGNWVDSNPGDRRLFLTSGPFSMAPGDTQVMYVAIVVGRSTDRLTSITDMRTKAHDVAVAFHAGTLDPPTAVESFLVDSHADGNAVHLVWRVSESPGTSITVERRTESTAWHDLDVLTLLPDGLVRFDDLDVVPGMRYGYRLTIQRGGVPDYSAESWVNVPASPATPSKVRLLPGRPNPSSAMFRIGHYVPRSGAFRLTVLDIHGRVVRVLEDRPLLPGWHDAVWDGRDDAGMEAASGVYVLRMEGAGENAVEKLVLMR
jgi:hypothetical protein